MIDEYSRFPEVDILSSVSAQSVISKIDKILSTHEIPDIIKSDNGASFNSKDFKTFSEVKGFTHRRIVTCCNVV